ncbi:MAM and LDL-receptor class A domain-containing protein 2-like [Pomacea canaliculata]|uniref:MAM and LDL-receptor class A domain-containing protein 2-like n=1 Tax=Pomacea canaliculata TaxID=400727 RepID=UPI000D73288A|nr:MAM and LDL-receptor class A domain-containing protein 2-like [Pomacea canaliculata]
MSFSGLPHTDHTTGKSSGHFLFARSHNPGDTAWLISRPFGATAGQCTCQMKLFFYIFGSNIHHLSILYRTHNAGPPDGQIWTSAGQQGPNWLEASPLISIATPFQIIIEAYVATADQAIAIDDVSFSPGCQHNATSLPPLSSTSTFKPMTSTTSARKTSNPLPVTCKNAELMCDNQQQCYTKDKLCDNKTDCVDGSDEAKSKCTCHSHLCFNGGQCSVKAGAGPICNCVKNYSGLDCKTPPAASGIGINTTPSGQQDNSSNSTKKWAIPVGVILGLLAIGATVGSVLVFRRRNGGLRSIRFPFALWRQSETNDGLSNPIYDHNSGDSDIHFGQL